MYLLTKLLYYKFTTIVCRVWNKLITPLLWRCIKTYFKLDLEDHSCENTEPFLNPWTSFYEYFCILLRFLEKISQWNLVQQHQQLRSYRSSIIFTPYLQNNVRIKIYNIYIFVEYLYFIYVILVLKVNKNTKISFHILYIQNITSILILKIINI